MLTKIDILINSHLSDTRSVTKCVRVNMSLVARTLSSRAETIITVIFSWSIQWVNTNLVPQWLNKVTIDEPPPPQNTDLRYLHNEVRGGEQLSVHKRQQTAKNRLESVTRECTSLYVVQLMTGTAPICYKLCDLQNISNQLQEFAFGILKNNPKVSVPFRPERLISDWNQNGLIVKDRVPNVSFNHVQ